MDRKQRGQTRIQDEFVNKKLKRFIEYLIFHKISVMNKINYQSAFSVWSWDHIC